MLRAVMDSSQTDVEKSARNRIAWRLLPFLFLLYVANYLDRTNIGFAALTMNRDIGLSATDRTYDRADRYHLRARHLLDDSHAFSLGVGAAAGLAFINSIGTLGGFAGPYMMGYLRDATGTSLAGLLAMAAVLLLTTLLAASLQLIIKLG